MTWLEFSAEAIAALAWPVVVVVALLTFRAPLGKGIDRLRSAKGYGLDLGFEERSDEARDDARAVIDDLQQGGVGDVPDPEPVRLPDDEDPTFAVIAAWERVGEATRDLDARTRPVGPTGVHDAGHPLPPPPLPGSGVQELARQLRRRDVVNDRFVESVDALGQLRNVVAHGRRRLTREEAKSYVEAARELTRAADAVAAEWARRRASEASAVELSTEDTPEGVVMHIRNKGTQEITRVIAPVSGRDQELIAQGLDPATMETYIFLGAIAPGGHVRHKFGPRANLKEPFSIEFRDAQDVRWSRFSDGRLEELNAGAR